MASKAAKVSPGSPSVSADDQTWRAQSDVRTLQDADEITRDPSRHRLAKRHATKQLGGLRRITGAGR